MRLTTRILNANGQQILHRVARCGSVQSLWGIVEARLIFSALVSIESEEIWREEAGQILTRLLVLLQENVQVFEEERVTPSGDFESELQGRKVLGSEDGLNQLG